MESSTPRMPFHTLKGGDLSIRIKPQTPLYQYYMAVQAKQELKNSIANLGVYLPEGPIRERALSILEQCYLDMDEHLDNARREIAECAHENPETQEFSVGGRKLIRFCRDCGTKL